VIDSRLLDRLKGIVGREYVAAGRADAEVYSYDASLAVAAPDAVVLPADTEQTAAVVRAAAEAGVAFVPRGFGTNLSGGSVAVRQGLILELSRLNRILEIEPEGRYAVVQPGVTNFELQNALAPLGFTYAPDPASQKVATLGGNAGENSGGPHCLKYGVTGNHVLGMTVVLSDGQVVRLGGPALDPPGYDLRGVLIGSEGTLGIFTELVVRIMPAPESVVTLLAVYDTHAEAAEAVSAVIAAGIVPATLEMMDSTVIQAVEDSKPCGYPRDAAAVLIIEVDGPAVGLQKQAERIREICTARGVREVRQAGSAAERDRLWAGRRGAFGAIARLSPNYLVADCTVPRTRLPEALARVADITEQHALRHGNVFHAGDGNLHPLLLFDSRVAEQLERVHRAGREIMQACVELGGTITGEHGVGMEKADAMRLIFSEDDLNVQRQLRGAFDPEDLLNPGKILPPPSGSEPAGRSPRPDGWPGQSAAVPQEVQQSGASLRSATSHPTDIGQSELVPCDVDEACAMVRSASLDGVALLPAGNGTRRNCGNFCDADVVPLRTAGLASILDYDPDNQVVVAEAGKSLEPLQEVLAERDQWLPLRPPGGGEHTLGGLAALGLCGPERLRYGAPRDLLLGLKFVCGTGELIAAGGRVVKNVAGYDLTRLMVGSAGTLGLIAELTFRLYPLPQRCVALAATGSFEQCSAAAAKLLGSKLEPNLVVAVPERATLQIGDGRPWQLIAGFEGFEETVDFQLAGAREIAAEAGLGDSQRRGYSYREGVCGRFFDALEKAPFILRTDLTADEVSAFVQAVRGALPDAAVLVDFGCGRITTAASQLTDEAWARYCTLARQSRGHVLLEKAAAEFARRHDVFGLPQSDWPLMHRVKAALDPHRVFVPGRLPGKRG